MRKGEVAFMMKEGDREEIKPTEKVKMPRTTEHPSISRCIKPHPCVRATKI